MTTISSETASAGGESPLSTNRKIRWRWGVLAALAMALLSLYPQIDLWITRGTEWQGSFASLSYDEETYAAYINGLVLGRPRRTLPLEIADTAKTSHESFYSIQVVPAYFAASLTRTLGFTVAETFILLTPLMAYLSTLVLFYLLVSITRDEAFAAVSALAVLVFGTLAARHSVALGWFGKNWYGSFLFLRRYTHAVAFPIFLGFIALTWQAFVEKGRKAQRAAITAGAAFAVLIFSHFFSWTAALAWLFCFTALWVVARPSDWQIAVRRLAPTVLCAAAALSVYAVLLSQRDPEIDKAQVPEFTHVPDFFRAPLWIAAAGIPLLLWGIKRHRVRWREPVGIFACSLVLMPFAAFNQQIITGRSLQPVHYELFSANYLSLLALILILVILWRGRAYHSERHVPGWLIALLSCVVLGWGIVEMNGVTSRSRERNIDRDRFVAVARRLAELAAQHGKGPNDREVVFSPDVLVVSENVATFAPQAPLMSMSLPFAAGLSIKEWHERYFQHLYYSGAKASYLLRALTNNELVATMSAFGYERYNPTLTTDFKPLTKDEIRDKVREYADYVANFNQERALHPRLSYVVVYNPVPFDFSNLDRWYNHDIGELIGPFTLYQVEPLGLSTSNQGKANSGLE